MPRASSRMDRITSTTDVTPLKLVRNILYDSRLSVLTESPSTAAMTLPHDSSDPAKYFRDPWSSQLLAVRVTELDSL